MQQLILSILLALEPAHGDAETWVERTSRMEYIAEAIDEASAKATCEAPFASDDCAPIWKGSRKDLATLLAVNGWVESKYARNVHEGKCRPYQCDSIKGKDGKIVYRARTPWQIHQSSYLHAGEWKAMFGSSPEATKVAADVAARILSDAYGVCKTVPGALARYGGAACTWKGVGYRYKLWQRIQSTPDSELENQKLAWEAQLSRKKVQIRIIPAAASTNGLVPVHPVKS